MKKQMYGLDYEWNSNHGPALVFSKNTAWFEHDLIALEKKMLLSYPISRLIPLQINEIDLQITLHYKLGNKKSLSQLKHQKPIKPSDCLLILFAVVTTIVESAMYLLNENRYLLKEEYIYVGADFTDINLIYLPIDALPDKPALQKELLDLANQLMKYQVNDQNSKILRLLESADFQLAALKEILFQFITEMETEPIQFIQFEIQPPIHSQLPPTTNDHLLKWKLPQSHNPNLVIACILTVLFIWVFFIIFPTAGAFNLCLGLSIMVANVSFWLNRSIGKMETGELGSTNSFEKSVQMLDPNLVTVDYYEHLADQTTLLAPKIINSLDATVLLPRAMKACLELVQGEETEIIQISSDSFIIGRNEEAVQFAANWIGLSRKHMEINRNGLEYEAKDLGSKNGSYLNDEPMIPHQSYPLNEGDQIKIVERQFVYKKI